MGFLESIGLLAILFVLLLLTLNYLSTKDHKIAEPDRIKDLDYLVDSQVEKIRRAESIAEKIEMIKRRIKENYGDYPDDIEIIELSRHSKMCNEYSRKRQRPLYDGNLGFYDNISRREIETILKDPLEYWTTLEKYIKHLDLKEKQVKKDIKRTELFIKYNEIVFSVFDTNMYRSEEELILQVQRQLMIEKPDSTELVKTWIDYGLIEPDYKDYEERKSEIYVVSSFLEYGTYESETKITRKNWLKRNNKQVFDNYSNY